MTPETITSHFVADFPPPASRTAGGASEQMIVWIVRNWDSLSREELMLFLGASELLAEVEVENTWLGATLAMKRVLECAVALDPPAVPAGREADSVGDLGAEAETAKPRATAPKWHETFPWVHTNGSGNASIATKPLI